MEIEEIKSNISKEKHELIINVLISQYEEMLDAQMLQAKICKAVGDEKGLEVHKKEALSFYNKIEALKKEIPTKE